MKDIINYLKVIPSTATRRIDKLVGNGLVKRNLSKDDGRLIKLTLTSEGKELFMNFMQNRLMSFDLIKQEFNEEELHFFFNVLDRMIRRSEEFKSKFP
jgi:DNA-binding MarR family transcriptional regulator